MVNPSTIAGVTNMENCKSEFLKWWNAKFDWDWHESGGVMESHLWQAFQAGRLRMTKYVPIVLEDNDIFDSVFTRVKNIYPFVTEMTYDIDKLKRNSEFSEEDIDTCHNWTVFHNYSTLVVGYHTEEDLAIILLNIF